jgi:hypothetical protein
VVRNNENNEKQDENQESLKTMNKASEILLGFINNRSALTLTHADVLVGIFPWNKPESITNTNPDIRAFILTLSILFSISS